MCISTNGVLWLLFAFPKFVHFFQVGLKFGFTDLRFQESVQNRDLGKNLFMCTIKMLNCLFSYIYVVLDSFEKSAISRESPEIQNFLKTHNQTLLKSSGKSFKSPRRPFWTNFFKRDENISESILWHFVQVNWGACCSLALSASPGETTTDLYDPRVHPYPVCILITALNMECCVVRHRMGAKHEETRFLATLECVKNITTTHHVI